MSWTQVHHLIPWAPGGRTDQTNGGLFCWHHHREIEHGHWEAFHHRGRIWLRPPEDSTRNEGHGSTTPTDHPRPEQTGHQEPTADPARRPRDGRQLLHRCLNLQRVRCELLS